MSGLRAIVIITLGGLGCGSSAAGNLGDESRFLSVSDLRSVPDGLSGLAQDPNGHLWAVSESGAKLVRFDGENRVAETKPLAGVPDGVELESMTFLANGDLVVGTESEASERPTDAILFARADAAGDLKVYGQMAVPYQMWGISAPSNQGIEGICAAGSVLIVVAESAIELDGKRFAPLAVYDLAAGVWRPVRLELTSDVGKISGLACRVRQKGIEFVAIERHFGIFRILRGFIGTSAVVTPSIAVELSGRPENFEGISWVAESSVAVVTDNFFGGLRDRDSKLFILNL